MMMNETSQESMESSNQIEPTDETLKIFIDIKLILDFNDFSVKDFIISRRYLNDEILEWWNFHHDSNI